MDGFQVAAHPLMGAPEAARVTERVSAALCAWRSLDPRGFRRARVIMRRVLIKSARQSYYYSAGDMCVLDLATAMSASIWDIAAVLVHEAAHARINRRRILYTPLMRDRIERFCVAQELAFVELIPADDCGKKPQWLESLRDYVRNGPPPDLAERQERHERQRSMLETLR